MKAISLWQPWASLIVLGAKTIETRSWATSYRGPLLIHAAKTTKEMDWILQPPFAAALDSLGGGGLPPIGAIIGKVELVGIWGTGDFAEKFLDDDRGGFCERDFGNYGEGRFGWILRDPVRFETPIPYRGRQGLFDVNEEEIFHV
jgi:activating signal cointegrator 1